MRGTGKKNREPTDHIESVNGSLTVYFLYVSLFLQEGVSDSYFLFPNKPKFDFLHQFYE